jgi:hypothetical protein
VRWAFTVAVVARLACATAPARAQEEAPPAPAPAFSSLELADRLRAMGSYAECAVEALRFAYERPAERPRGFDRAALCLSLAGRFDDARRLMLSLSAGGPSLDAAARFRLCLIEAFMPVLGAPACGADRRAPAGPAINPAVGEGDAARLDALADHALIMRALRAGRWQDARASLARADRPPAGAAADATLAAWRAQDRAFVARYDGLPKKSPLLAASLSAVLPGLGRVYIGRWQDGLVSFFLVGVAAALSAQGFHENGVGSVRGWILGTTATLLYAGNIYGSAIGALVQRRDAEDALTREVDREYHTRLER